MTILTLVIAVASVFAAAAAWRAALETRKAAQSALLSQLLSEYASDEMFDAMVGLRRFRQDFGAGFAQVYVYLLRSPQTTNVKRGDELRKWRRRVSHYLFKVKLLSEAGLLEKEPIDKAFGLGNAVGTDNVSAGPVEFLVDVVEPLEEAYARVILGKSYDADLFEYYRRRYNLLAGPSRGS